MTKTIQIAANAVAAKVLSEDRDLKLLISDKLSYLVEGAEFTNAFKTGSWDGRSSFFDYRRGVFPAGFVSLVVNELTIAGYNVQLVRQNMPAPLGPEEPIIDEFGNDDPRYDYQMETVRRLVATGQMIAQVATGGGKSRIAHLAIARIARPTLFLTTRSVLMYQMRDRLVSAKMRVGILGDGEWKPNLKGMNVGMIQTLVSRLQLPDDADMSINAKKQRAVVVETRRLLETFEFVILEEAHEAGGNSYYEVLKRCKNAHYRLSLTATPFMRGDAEANMRLMACSGSIGIQISEKMLIDRGILATPIFKFVDTEKPAKLYRTTSWPRCYNLGVVENEHRNRAALFETVRAAKMGLPVMMLVQRKAHGLLLEKALKAAGIGVKFLFGEHDQATRRHWLDALRDGNIQVLIGSTILDVGVDVPAVGMIVLLGGGKAEVAHRQRIGRGLRAKKTGPNVCFVVDFTDQHNQHLREHAETRRAIVTATPGFVENILVPGADFDFSSLGFKRAA